MSHEANKQIKDIKEKSIIIDSDLFLIQENDEGGTNFKVSTSTISEKITQDLLASTSSFASYEYVNQKDDLLQSQIDLRPLPPNTSGTVELISDNGVSSWVKKPYETTNGGLDAKFLGDVFAQGNFHAQQSSIIFGNSLKIGVSGDKFIITDEITGQQSLIAKNDITARQSNGMKDLVRYDPFTKNDTIGQPQPDDSLTFNSTSFVDNAVELVSVNVVKL